MPLITDEQIDRLEQVVASATPGPWTPGKSPTETAETVGAYFADAYRANPDGPIHLVCVPVDDKTEMNETALFTAVTGNGPTSEENAYFIACARTAIPALIADLRAARADLREARASLAATERELERWRHGVTVEGDFVCPDSLQLDEARRLLERALETLDEVSNSPTGEALRVVIRRHLGKAG